MQAYPFYNLKKPSTNRWDLSQTDFKSIGIIISRSNKDTVRVLRHTVQFAFKVSMIRMILQFT